MADLVCNVAKGKVNSYHDKVNDNDPAAAQLTVVALVVTGDQDDAIRDADTLAAVLALANVAEATNTGYTRQNLTDTDVSASTVDDTNNRREADIPDVTFSSVSAGDNWTDLLIVYGEGGADATLVPLTLHDFSVTPDGSDIVAQPSADGYFRAA